MKLIVLLCCLVMFCPAAHAGDTDAARDPAGVVKKSERGDFSLEMTLGGKELKQGPNTLDITLRDREGRAVRGAELAVTPWMPMMGHGVWDKPVVTERDGGVYHVENVMIIMNGLWELKVGVRSGALEDRASFGFYVAEKEPPPKQEPAPAKERYERTVKNYVVPNVTLLNQDGKKVNLRTLTDSGKPIVMNFIFTTCTTICPVLSAGFSNLRKQLGEEAEKVQLISVSIDPEHDRPEQLKAYGERFEAGTGWDFLTGSRDDIGRVLKAFDAFVTDKMSHEPLYIFRAPNSEEWVRVKGLVGKSDLMKEFRRIETR